MTLRIAVLGAGRIGKMHAELVARQVPGASLAMVQDINGDAAAEVGAQFDSPHTTDHAAVLASQAIEKNIEHNEPEESFGFAPARREIK